MSSQGRQASAPLGTQALSSKQPLIGGKGGFSMITWTAVSTAFNFILVFVLIGLMIPRNLPSYGKQLLQIGSFEDKVVTRKTQVAQEECIPPAYPLEGPDSDWYTLKAFPHPDPCLVQGVVVESLEPQYNFRRPYTLGFTDDIEDRAHIIPYLRAFQDRTMATRKRRVLVDLGGKWFETSTLWFLRNYPLSFTEIHVFEVKQGAYRVPQPQNIQPDLLEHLSSTSRVPGAGSLPVPERNLKSITLHEAYAGIQEKAATGGGVPTVDVTKFLLDTLKLTRNDAVVIKMDIEYEEWEVLPLWMEMPEMPLIIDELFVEVHYKDPSMWGFHWRRGFPRSNTTELFKRLRQKGFVVHPWP